MDFFKDFIFVHPQTSQPEPPPGGIGTLFTCRVQGGDILWDIPRRFGTMIGRLIAPDHISDPNVICKGQILEVPDILKA